METQNLIFCIAAVILFGFCFRLNTFTSKNSNLLLPLRAEGGGVVNLDIPYFSLLLLVAFLLEHNVDEKNMRNINIRIHVKLEVKVPIDIFLKPTPLPLLLLPPAKKNNDPLKNLDPRKKIDPRKKC